MENILDKIIANKHKEVLLQKQEISIAQLEQKIASTANLNLFKKSLANSSTGIIAEFKRRSPSRGWIFEQAKVDDVVSHYAQGGASAISVLT
ncbi:MAG: indole-3-glycerol phosphate synthase TrpC, partial [Bacteroidota bacterium]